MMLAKVRNEFDYRIDVFRFSKGTIIMPRSYIVFNIHDLTYKKHYGLTLHMTLRSFISFPTWGYVNGIENSRVLITFNTLNELLDRITIAAKVITISTIEF